MGYLSREWKRFKLFAIVILIFKRQLIKHSKVLYFIYFCKNIDITYSIKVTNTFVSEKKKLYVI